MSVVPVSDRLSPLTSQAVFRVLLDSLARPGRVFQLPSSACGHCVNASEPDATLDEFDKGVRAADRRIGPGIVPLALAVIGSKVAVIGAPSWQERICRATGAAAADIGEASLVAIYGAVDPATISLLRRGSAAAPEDGAKVGLGCAGLTEGRPGDLTVELSGPGVPGSARLGVDGVDRAVFDALRSANSTFPAGVDVWLVDERGQIAGLPRSARLAVA
jgi:alpha-D-ribose 1-methylphosphonate 5-triphosphate synthase subunit PhnH